MFAWMLCAAALAQEPARTAWIMAPAAANESLRRSLPEVHSVSVNADIVEVRSAGFSLHFLGPFQKPLTGKPGEVVTRLPLHPAMEQGARPLAGAGAVGLFLNGVPLYNLSAEASYLGQNIWHFDTLAYNDDGSKVARIGESGQIRRRDPSVVDRGFDVDALGDQR